MKSFRFEAEARAELRQYTEYYDAISAQLGDRFLEDVYAAIRDIREYPQIGHRILRQARKRVLRKFKYSVVYIDRPEMIVIVAIAPHKKRPWYWRGRGR